MSNTLKTCGMAPVAVVLYCSVKVCRKLVKVLFHTVVQM